MSMNTLTIIQILEVLAAYTHRTEKERETAYGR